MRKLFLLTWLQLGSTAAFSQTLPYVKFVNPPADDLIHIQRTNLVVRWKASPHPWPKTVWTYRVRPSEPSPLVISNLMALGPFTDKDRTYSGTNGMVFGHPYATPYLDINFIAGTIDYDWGERNYTPASLAIDVPGTNQLVRLATNLVSQIGISPAEIAKRENGQLRISWPDPSDSYSFFFLPDHTVISNATLRQVWLHRALDGVEFNYGAGGCEIWFGEHSHVIKLRLDWRAVERDKQYAAATPDHIIQWIREGRAIQKRMLTGHGGETFIDWPNVKSLTVRRAKAYYWGEFFGPSIAAHPSLPSWVWPYAEISGTVDTGKTNLNVEIVCPIIDETQSPDVKHSR